MVHRDDDWKKDAACRPTPGMTPQQRRDLTHLFVPGEHHPDHTDRLTAKAKRFCAKCTVTGECAEDGRATFDMWTTRAGLTPTERHEEYRISARPFKLDEAERSLGTKVSYLTTRAKLSGGTYKLAIQEGLTLRQAENLADSYGTTVTELWPSVPLHTARTRLAPKPPRHPKETAMPNATPEQRRERKNALQRQRRLEAKQADTFNQRFNTYTEQVTAAPLIPEPEDSTSTATDDTPRPETPSARLARIFNELNRLEEKVS